MTYPEFIPESVEAEVRSWKLSSSLLRLLWETAVAELRTRPESQFGNVVAPLRYLILPLSLTDPDTGQPRTFVFYVDIWVRPGERTVIEIRDADNPRGSVIVDGTTSIGEPPEFLDS